MDARGSRLERAARRGLTARRPEPGTAGTSFAIATSSPTPSSGRPSARAGRCRSPRGRPLITDFSSYNTDLTPQGRAASPVRGPAVVPAPLGGRPHALLPGDGARAAGPAPARADQGRPVEPVRDRPGHRPGHALPRRSQPWASPRRRALKSAGNLRARPGQRRRPADAPGRRQPAVRRGPVYETSGPESRLMPTAADLEPARVGAQGADLDVSGLVLKRDVYYTLAPGDPDDGGLREPRRARARAHSSTCSPIRRGLRELGRAPGRRLSPRARAGT